ncbi:MAG TPA: hypothetical protein VGN26_12455 [Armatimonadota bacterium]
MPIPGLDPEKCAFRNALAARRDGIEAAPITLLAGAPSGAEEPITRRGSLPATELEALERINALLPAGSTPLQLSQVWIHYAEAANASFIGDRFAFLGDTTLRNIADDAAAGVAFMNSHRDGDLSHPAELPYGKTFAGCYEELADGTRRALVGLYMLRGALPNGDLGPTTDTLHQAIEAGTLFDVSVRLSQGEATCDVCGLGLNDSKCPHIPGTTRKMSAEQQQAQAKRGVRKGCASYTVQDGRLGEVSGVYDGAVNGAGFRKAFQSRRGLVGDELEDVKLAYGGLWDPKRGLSLESVRGVLAEALTDALAALGVSASPEARESVTEMPDDKMPDESPQGAALAAKPEVAAAGADPSVVEQLQARLQAVEQEAAQLRAREDRRQVEARLSSLKFGSHSLTPKSRETLGAVLLGLEPQGRTAVLDALAEVQLVQFGEVGFTADEASDPDKPSEARVAELAGMTDIGQAALASRKGA